MLTNTTSTNVPRTSCAEFVVFYPFSRNVRRPSVSNPLEQRRAGEGSGVCRPFIVLTFPFLYRPFTFTVLKIATNCISLLWFQESPPPLPIRNSPQWATVSSSSRIHDHTQTHHTRWDSSGRVSIPLRRPLPDNTQHSQQTDIHALDRTATISPPRNFNFELK